MLLPACSNDVELAENDMEMPETVEVALNMVGDAVTVSESPLTRAFNGAEELYAVQVYFQDPGEAYENLIDAKTKKPVYDENGKFVNDSTKPIWQYYAYGIFDDASKMKIQLSTKLKYKFECTKITEGLDKIFFVNEPNASCYYSLPFYNLNYAHQNHERIKQNDKIVNTYDRNIFHFSDKVFLTGIREGKSYIKLESDEAIEIAKEKKYLRCDLRLDDNGNDIQKDTLYVYGERWYPGTDRLYGQLCGYVPTLDGMVNIPMKRTAFGMLFNVKTPTDGKLKITCDSVCDIVVYPDLTRPIQVKTKTIGSLFSFAKVDECWGWDKNENNKNKTEYEHQFKINFIWERANGSKNVFTKTVEVKRNQLTTFNVDLNGISDNGVNIQEDEEVTFNETVNVPE